MQRRERATRHCSAANGAGRIIVPAAALLSISLASENPIGSQEGAAPGEPCAELGTDSNRWGDEIVLLEADVSAPTNVIEQAVALWQRCDGYATAFPRFVVGEGQGPRVTVRLEKQIPGQGHCGRFAGRTITIHRLARLEGERIVVCPPPARVLAHELGHVLGLRDVDPPRGCPTYIMSEIVVTRPPLQRVETAECRAVGRRWLTSRERDREAARTPTGIERR